MNENIRKPLFQKMAEFFFTVYVISLYLFVLRKDTLIISQICFILFAGFSIMYLLQRKRFYLGKSVAIAYFNCMWIFASLFWAQSRYIAMVKAKTMWQIFLLFFLIYNLYYENENAHKQFIKTLYIAGIALCVYSVYTYGMSGIIEAMTSGNAQRLGREISQENVYGMNHAITALIAFYYIFYIRRHRLFHSCVLCAAFVLSMSSGSRKALIMICVGCLYMIYKEYGFKKLYKAAAVMLAAGIVFSFVIQMPMFETVRTRMESGISGAKGERGGDTSALNRMKLIRVGLETFKNKPFTGYGADNYRIATSRGSYSHNNFVEVLVDFGLIGFILYYGMYLMAFKSLLKNNTNEGKLLLVFFVTRLVLEVANVTYYEKNQWMYMSFFLMTQGRMLKYTASAKEEEKGEFNPKNG